MMTTDENMSNAKSLGENGVIMPGGVGVETYRSQEQP